MSSADTLWLRPLGMYDYAPVYDAMQRFTAERDDNSPDELWLVEHPAVFTQGRNSKPEHLLRPGDIPVIDIDRGGQVTYHGPGQLVVYTLIDLNRKKMGVRDLVTAMEKSIIELLADYRVQAEARTDAPGVYVDGAKIASLGLRIKRGRSYHGLALNIDADLEPFSRINPCGYKGLAVTRLHDVGIIESRQVISEKLCTRLANNLGYNKVSIVTD